MEIPVWAAAVLVFVISLGGGFVAWHFLRRRPTPEEIERLRRLTVHREGKLGDGEILDVEGSSIVYSYSVAGVVYTASQDATTLEEKLPADRQEQLKREMEEGSEE